RWRAAPEAMRVSLVPRGGCAPGCVARADRWPQERPWSVPARPQIRWRAAARQRRRIYGRPAAVAVRRSRGSLRNQRVEPWSNEVKILLVLEGDANRSLERIRPAGTALVQQGGGFRPVDGFRNPRRLAERFPSQRTDR